MAQGEVDPIDCPRFKFISESYISNASSPEESLGRSEEIRVNKTEFHKKALERGSLKCICPSCISIIWDLST